MSPARTLVVVVVAVVVLVIAGALVVGGCPRAPLPEVERLTSAEVARVRLEREGDRRQRMSGHVKARAAGIEGLLASADLDVLIERPARLHIAVRSFFEQPMLVLATDGVVVTGVDATRESGPVFLKGPASGETFAPLLGAELWPHDLVALFLAVPPAAGAIAEQLVIDERARTYSVGLREPRGYASVVTARVVDDVMVRWQRYDEGGALLFDARYRDLEDHAGVAFAHQLELSLPGGSEDVPKRVRFEAKAIEVNGAPFDPRAFTLEQPPGLPVLPL